LEKTLNSIRYNSLTRFADIVIDFPDELYTDEGIDIIHGKKSLSELPEIKPFDKIFVKSDLLREISTSLRGIQVPFHLFTGSSDISFQPELLNYIQHNPNMLSWTGQNLIKLNHKFLQVPIGFQEIGPGRPNSSFNFPAPSTNKNIPIVVTPVKQTVHTRSGVKNIQGKNIVNVQERVEYSKYIELLNSSLYSVCPFGNGVDTHRVIESIQMGSKPIVLNSMLNHLYTEMGCLIINDWSEIDNIDIFAPVQVDSKFTTLSYWKNRIDEHQKTFEGK
jgi:hypothetical protein